MCKISKFLNSYAELNISGVVLNDKNEVVPNAIVEIPSYGIRKQTTDIDGKFTIFKELVTDGRDAEIKVEKEDHHTRHKTIDLNDKNIQIILKGR